MPYIPYWFESFGPWFPWIVPAIALSGLWLANSSQNGRFQKVAERVFYAAMLVVAGAALRTVLANEGCWLLHMASMVVMILGATFPQSENSQSEHDNEVIFTDF